MSSQPRTLTINSQDRTLNSISSTDFYVDIIPAITYASKFQLISAIIPNTTYNISSSNNVLNWQEASTTNYQAVIVPGSYSAVSLATAIAAAMNAVGTVTYSASYNQTTYKMTIANSATTFFFTFGTNQTNSIARSIGYTAANGSIGSSQVSQGAVQLADPLYYYIKIDKIQQGCRGSNNIDYGTFFVENSSAPNGSINYFNMGNNYPMDEPGGGIYVNSMKVKLYKWNNQPVDLNGSDWNFTLGIFYDSII
jgi:hypothetical protein